MPQPSFRPLRHRSLYLLIIAGVIILGLLSRRSNLLPSWIGDLLYALMMYFGLRFLLVRKSIGLIAALSLAICWLIECSQLYQAPWINTIRATIPGRLILGQGFLWSDLAAYAGGVLTGACTEMLRLRMSGKASHSADSDMPGT